MGQFLQDLVTEAEKVAHYKGPEENSAAGYCSVSGPKQRAVGKTELPPLFIKKAQTGLETSLTICSKVAGFEVTGSPCE